MVWTLQGTLQSLLLLAGWRGHVAHSQQRLSSMYILQMIAPTWESLAKKVQGHVPRHCCIPADDHDRFASFACSERQVKSTSARWIVQRLCAEMKPAQQCGHMMFKKLCVRAPRFASPSTCRTCSMCGASPP